jgi:hypothetical protein
MNKRDFEQLSLHNKLSNLFENGEELFLRHSDGFTVKLYQLNDFFCEIWYSSEANQIYNVQTIDVKDVASLYKIDLDLDNIINQ